MFPYRPSMSNSLYTVIFFAYTLLPVAQIVFGAFYEGSLISLFRILKRDCKSVQAQKRRNLYKEQCHSFMSRSEV